MKEQNSQVLKIVIKGEYFDAIAAKEKTIEYREKSPFWDSRLYDRDGNKRQYQKIEFINGYNKDARRMLVEYKGFKTKGGIHHIQLGRILKKMF